jgi:regulator of sigma E protease
MQIILSCIIILCPLIIFHELGHYWVGRWRKVQVETFSIGFGPALFQWKDKHGTMWKFCPYLLGGYVKFLGDADPSGFTTIDTKSSTSITHKKPWEKILIALAGPVANYILAFGLVLVLAYGFGLPNMNRAVIGRVVTASKAEGLLFPQDEIVRVQEQSVHSFQDILRVLKSTPLKDDLQVTVRRQAQEVPVTVEGAKDTIKERFWHGHLGIMPSLTWGAPKHFGHVAVFFVDECAKPFHMFSKVGVSNLSGPLGIATQARDVLAQQDLGQVLLMMIALSIALGFFNLLPIPLLDGGNVMLNLIEWIRGKPLSDMVTHILLWGSLLLLGGVFLISSVQDLQKFAFVQELVNWIKGWL